MNIVIIGTGMYVSGRGTDGYGTILPAIIEWKRKTYHKDVAKTFRMLPTTEVEGFYVARLRKVG